MADRHRRRAFAETVPIPLAPGRRPAGRRGDQHGEHSAGTRGDTTVCVAYRDAFTFHSGLQATFRLAGVAKLKRGVNTELWYFLH